SVTGHSFTLTDNGRRIFHPFGPLRFRIDLGRDLVPDLDFVAVGIVEEEVRLAGDELAALLDGSTRFPHDILRVLNVLRPLQTKSKVHHAARLSCLPRLALEDDHVATAWRLDLNEVLALVDRNDAEHVLIKARRALRISHGEGHVCETVRLDRPISGHAT